MSTPGGAYGRYRTLHELAVTTALIAEYGRTPEHADLADRYLDHTHIEHYKQAQQFQRSSPHLGWQPFSQETMRMLRGERDRVIALYGRDYAQLNGWAAGLIRPPLSFERLEAKANMNLLRYFYVTGSHLVHATAHGLRMTLAPEQGEVSVTAIAGPSDVGLCQPAQDLTQRTTRRDRRTNPARRQPGGPGMHGQLRGTRRAPKSDASAIRRSSRPGTVLVRPLPALREPRR